MPIDDPRDIPDEDWIVFNGKESGDVYRNSGEKLQGSSQFVVYCIQCELYGDELSDAKTQATEFISGIDEAPDWIYHAWESDFVYYVGQTRDFGRRLEAHAVKLHIQDADLNPSRLCATSWVIGAGIIKRVETRTEAEVYEKLIAEHLSTSEHDKFIYQA